MVCLGLSEHARMWIIGREGEEVTSHVTVTIWVTESKVNEVSAKNTSCLEVGCKM